MTGYFCTRSIGTDETVILIPVTPCRVLDTRLSSGAFEGKLTVPFTTGNDCNVPDAQAYVMNAKR